MSLKKKRKWVYYFSTLLQTVEVGMNSATDCSLNEMNSNYVLVMYT